MEEKRETVNGPMLVAKRADFQKAFNGLEDERLPSEDWIARHTKSRYFVGMVKQRQLIS